MAILDPISGIVYFLGGSFYNHSTPIEQRNVSLGFAYTFDTKIGNWSQQVFGGDRPSQRYSHTLVPNSHDILLYGGSKDNLVASSDFCYTLNLDSNTWTRQGNVIVPSALSGPRFSHSSKFTRSNHTSDNTLTLHFIIPYSIAVLINTTLYVLFGRNVDTVKVSGSEAKNNTNTETSSSTTGLSKGAIGGIAGGAAIVVSLFLLFFL